MTLKDMEDVLEIREALDELAVKIACDKISEKELQKLLEVKDQFENSTKDRRCENDCRDGCKIPRCYFLNQREIRKTRDVIEQSAGADLPVPCGIYQKSGQLSGIDRRT